jgi:tetratricopeptide (TPR) repeat protein
LTCSGSLERSGDSGAEAVSRAEVLRLEGRYEEAATEFDRVLARNTGDLFALSRRASITMILAARKQAIATRNSLDMAALEARYRPILRVFDHVLIEAPGDFWTRCQRVEVLRCMKLHEECLAECRRLLLERPDFGWGYQRMAWAQRWRLEFDDALQSIEHAIRLDPAVSWSRGYRALLLGMTRRIEESEAEFDELHRVEPAASDQWTLERGIILLFNDRARQAVPFLMASRTRSDAYLANYFLAVADSSRSSVVRRQVAAEAQMVLRTEGWPLGHYMLAGLCTLDNDVSGAVKHLELALPGNDVVLEAALCDPTTRPLMLSSPLKTIAAVALADRRQAIKYLWPSPSVGALGS